MLDMSESYGTILSYWRKKRRYSQLAFALHADVSARHLSFLETGRAKPSRPMVLKLADYLEIPKPEVNRALLAAGYAPVYKMRHESDADLIPVQKAISKLLENHMPYPAIGIDRHWNILYANQAAIDLITAVGFAGETNFLTALASQTPEESCIINWDEAISLILMRLRAEIEFMQDDKILQQLVQTLTDHFHRYCTNDVIDRAQAIIPTRFQIGDQVISLFSTIAHFGAVQDIVVSDLKVELMFPIDAQSEQYFLTG